MGGARLQLAVQFESAARAQSGRGVNVRLLPHVVRQLQRDREHGADPGRLHGLLRHRAVGRPVPGRRRRPDLRQLRCQRCAGGTRQTVVKQASDFGTQTEVYNGIDLTVQCTLEEAVHERRDEHREDHDQQLRRRRQQSPGLVRFADGSRNSAIPTSPWSAQTQVKFAAVYTLPWEVQTSATMQAYPGLTQRPASPTRTRRSRPSLGRNLSSCGTSATCAGTAVINVVPSNQIFEDRYAQFDVRFAKERQGLARPRFRAFSTSSTPSTPGRCSA